MSPRRRKWLRRLLVLLVLAALLRAALPWVLPTVARSALAGQGLSVSWDSLELALHSGDVRLEGLRVRERASGETDASSAGALVLGVDSLVVDVDVSRLLGGALVLHRVEVDGLEVHARRDAEGVWDFERYFAAADPDAQAAEDTPSEDAAPKAGDEPPTYDLRSPIAIESLRLQHVRLYVHDDFGETFDARLELEARLVDLGAAEAPAHLTVRARAPGLLDSLSIDVTLRATGEAAEAELDLGLAGLHARPLSAFLAPLGLEPLADAVSGGARLTASATTSDGATVLDARVELSDLRLTADGETSLSLAAVEASTSLAPGSLGSPRVALRGLRARAQRLADGRLAAAGFAFAAPPASAAGEPAPEPAGPAKPDAAPLAIRAANLILEDVHLSLRDAAVAPPVELEATLTRVAVEDLTLNAREPAGGELPPARLSAELALPGVAERIELGGELRLAAAATDARLELDVVGVAPERLAPYLAELGWRSELTAGRLHAGAAVSLADEDGRTRIDAELSDLTWSDVADGVETELASLARVRLARLVLADPSAGGGAPLELAELELVGGRFDALRRADGTIAVAGLASLPSAARPAPRATAPPAPGATASPASTAPDAAPRLPALVVDRVRWTDARLAWRDEAVAPPLALALSPVELALDGLALGVPGARPPARLSLRLGIDGLCDALELTGELGRPEAGGVSHRVRGVDADLTLAARGLDLDRVAPYLAPLGIESEWVDGSLGAHLRAGVRETADGLLVELTCEELELAPAGVPVLGLRALSVDRLLLGAGGVVVGDVTVREPWARLRRGADGVLHVAGLRLVSPEAAAAPPAAPGTAPAPSGSPGAPATASPEVATASAFTLARLALEDARVDWRDEALEPPLELRLGARGELTGLTLGAAAEPAHLRLALGVPGALEELALEAQVRPDPEHLSLTARITGRGVTGRALAPYFPPGLETRLADGALALALEARWDVIAEGGHAGSVTLHDLRFADGERAWLDLPRAAAVVTRFDPEGGRIDVSELVLEGLGADAGRDEAGALEFLGLALVPVEPASTEPASTELAPAPAAPPGDVLADAALGASTRPARVWPEVRLGRFALELARLRFHDRSAAGTAPVELSLALSTPPDVVLAGPQPEDLPPLTLSLRGAASPLLDAIEADVTLAPYRPEPSLEVRLALTGFHGEELPRVLPELAAKLDASELSNGHFELRLAGDLHARRRSPIDFDLSSGFGLDLRLEGLALRPRPEAEPLLGLGALNVTVESIRPATGDVHVETVEVFDSLLRVRKEAGGLRVAGVLLRTPTESADGEVVAPPSAPPPTEDRAPGSELAAAPATGTPHAASPEVRVDQLIVQGLDLTFEDESVEPPMLLPLNDLELEVRRFTTRALVEPRPVRFRASVGAGLVPLPPRTESGNLVSGLISGVGSLVRGKKAELEERPAFDELSASGSLVLVPAPTGWVRLGVHALELTTFRGPAAAAGVTIGDGVLDGDYELRLLGERGAAIATTSHLASLDLSEPKGGPIERFLNLPAPLGAVLYLLADANGEHTIPLSFGVGPDGVSVPAIAAAAGRTFLELVTRALADSPFRLIGGVLDLTGLDFSSEPVDVAEERAELSFAPGSADLAPQARAALERLALLLRADESIQVVLTHTFGAGDRERAAERANPDPADLLDLVRRLQAERAGLWRERDGLAAEAQTAYATGANVRADALRAQLVELDREVTRTESALDEVAELLRPGAEQRKDRRTRAALRALGTERLDAAVSVLREVGVPNLPQRVRVRRPRIEEAPAEGTPTVDVLPRRRGG